ncbi:MAG TPA: glutathione S-transferase family protein [Polyangiales bacterium]|nr:glutathione S-transferase family protein [Polyangiales bacterium]
MSEEIVFYYNPMSRARTVHWMLEEVGVPYRTELVRFDKNEHKKPEFLRLNPMGKLPTLVHKGVVITESAAICTYLADAFPQAKLAPALDDPRRGTYLRWIFFGAGCVEPALVDKGFQRTPVDRPAGIGYGTFEDTFNTLEKALLPGPFVLGDQFSTADVWLGSMLGWGFMSKALEPRPTFTAYLERLSKREAFQRYQAATEKAFAQLKSAS